MIDFILHRILRRPYRMRVRRDNHPKNPQLTVVLLHGIASSSSAWRKTVEQLITVPDLKSVRFISLDLIGFGKNRPTKYFHYNYANYRKALHLTLQKLRVNTPVILAGHSMGALIAIDYVEHYPKDIRSLLLVSPPFLKPTDLHKLPDKFYLKSFTALSEHTSDPVIKTFANFVSHISSFEHISLDTKAFRQCMNNIVLNDHNWQSATKLNIPTTLIHGRLDPLVVNANLRDIAKRNRHITFIESLSGHDITGAKRTKTVNTLKQLALAELRKNSRDILTS